MSPRERELAHLVELCQRGILSAADAEDVVQTLYRALNVQAIGFAQGGGYSGWNLTFDVPHAWLEAHRAHQALDPSTELLAGSAPGTFFLVQSDTRPEHRSTPLYDAFVNAGLQDGAIAKLYNPFVDDLYLAIYRKEGTASFGQEDRALLALVYPHLAGALAARRAIAAAESSATVGALPPVRAYVHLVWPGARVEWSGGGRAFWQERLGPITPSHWRRIERSIRRAAECFSAAQTGGRSQLLVRGIRTELAFVRPERGEVRRMLALFVDEADASNGPVPPEEMLTPRELTIARAAAGGSSVPAIAQALGVTPETVRSQLKSAYARLRISRRTELALLLDRSRRR